MIPLSRAAALAAALLLLPPDVCAQGALAPDATPLQIVRWAGQRAGGDAWLHARSNRMEGWAQLCRGGAIDQCVRADRYVMHRVYPTNLESAHAGTGKFRLDATRDGQVIFRMSYDGERSYDQHGPLPPERAARSEASGFGFSAIRFADRPGFTLQRLADDSVEGHPCFMVRVTDPSGSSTLFAIDQESAYIRLAAWDTPKGWHQRIYSDYYWVEDPGFLQPGRVRLYYAGAKEVDIRWTSATINEPIRDEVFVIDAE
jgi:hypothetical protein